MNEKAQVTASEKHEQLDAAIENVRTAVDKAEEIYNRIMGCGDDQSEGKDRDTVCLSEILENGSNRLYKNTEDILGVLYKIEEAIF